MNEQLPPVDLDLRAQLERRAAGRVPTELLGNVLAELDSVPVSRPIVALRPRSEPRTVSALVGVAAVLAIVAALVAVPALHNGPSAPGGYPVYRALTTSELAALMSGPALPTNTALVANVTIQVRNDVCPMNRYPTIGVIEGMPSQVCAVGAGVGAHLNVGSQGGVYAFRYLGPGVLGLIGNVRAASTSTLAFGVLADWPVSTDAFVVHGWLGAEQTGAVASCSESPGVGDTLLPYGDDCPYTDWLAADRTATAISTPAAQLFSRRSMDPIALYGNARLVAAGGMRILDGLDLGSLAAGSTVTPIEGDYVVRSTTGACPGYAEVSSMGCPHWLVLAKLGAIVVPSPTPAPSATPRPQAPSGYPIDRALTTAELGRLLDAGSLKQYDTVVVDAQVTAEASGACKSPPIFDLAFAGFIVRMDPQVCVFAVPGATIAPGHLLLRVLAGRTLGYMLTLPDTSLFAYSATDAWPQGDFLVHGWLGTDPRDCGKPGAQPTMMGYGLFPDGRVMCYAALTATAFDHTRVVSSGPTPAGPPRLTVGEWELPADGQAVDPGPLFSMPGASPVGGSVEGTYVVEAGHHCSEYGDCLEFSVLARLAYVALPEPTPSPTSTPQPPATPAPPTPSGYPAVPSTGVWAPGNRPLTVAELYTACSADPQHLAGRIVVTKGPLPTDTRCWKVDAAVSCAGSSLLPEGYLVIQFDSAGKPTLLGQLSSPGGRFVSTLAQISGGGAVPSDSLVVVDGYLVESVGPHCDSSPLGARCLPSIVDSLPESLSSYRLTVQDGAYRSVTGRASDPAQNGPPIYGQFLMRITVPMVDAELLAQINAIPLPATTPSAGSSATVGAATKTTGLWGSGDRPLTVDELFTYWRANHTHLDGQVVVAKGPFPTETGCWAVGASCAVGGEVGEGYWVLRFDAQGKATVLGELSTSGSAFVWTIDAVKSSSSLKPGDIVAVDGLLEYWLNFCDIQRVGGCSQSWIVRPDDNILFSIEVQEDAYATFASSSSLGGPKVRGIYLVRVGEGNAPWTLIARLDTTGSANP